MKRSLLYGIVLIIGFMLVVIQPANAKHYIRDDATGGDCGSIGIWDGATKTCTLTTGVNQTIQIDSDGVTLNGNAFTVSVSGELYSIYLPNRTGVTIENVNVEDANSGGIFLYQSSNNILTGNTASNNYCGIYLQSSSCSNTLTGNDVSNNHFGICISSSSNNTLIGNTVSFSVVTGISLAYSGNNTLKGNTVSDNLVGVSLGHNTTVSNTLKGNTISNNSSRGMYLWDLACENLIYNNNFIDNPVPQADVDSVCDNGSNNVFNKDKPIGGNYWSGWTSPDNDNDGFVDNPYVLGGTIGGQDNLPLTDLVSDYEGPVCEHVLADPNPVAVNAEIKLTARIDDTTTGASDIFSAEYKIDIGGEDWSAMDPADTFDSPMEDVEAAFYSPESAGIYDVCVRGEDLPGNVGEPECIMLVVYNPEGAFVTGGGWIDSQAGSYIPDPFLAGKANFGFVSKYKKGATFPSGQTEFRFQVADLDFHSESYDWLIVNQGGTNAQFKGRGTINGDNDDCGDPYRFMVWAGGGEPDTFRIKIWSEDESTDNETVIYDNGVQQAIGGGSIVIH